MGSGRAGQACGGEVGVLVIHEEGRRLRKTLCRPLCPWPTGSSQRPCLPPGQVDQLASDAREGGSEVRISQARDSSLRSLSRQHRLFWAVASSQRNSVS